MAPSAAATAGRRGSKSLEGHSPAGSSRNISGRVLIASAACEQCRRQLPGAASARGVAPRVARIASGPKVRFGTKSSHWRLAMRKPQNGPAGRWRRSTRTTASAGLGAATSARHSTSYAATPRGASFGHLVGAGEERCFFAGCIDVKRETAPEHSGAAALRVACVFIFRGPSSLSRSALSLLQG
jgi:hypothetical protein